MLRIVSFLALICLAGAVQADKFRPSVMLYALDNTLHRSAETLENLGNHEKVVYSFWSFTCPPCMDEFPQLIQLQKKNAHIRFLYINVLDEKAEIARFATEKEIPLGNILLDERLVAARNFKILNADKQPVLPQIFVLNNRGTVVFHSTGFTDKTLKSLVTALEAK